MRKDVATERFVKSLKVKCCKHESGCVWKGELRDMDVHNAACVYQREKNDKILLEELTKCRNELEQCRTEVVSLKEQMKNSEEQQTKQQQQIDALSMALDIERAERKQQRLQLYVEPATVFARCGPVPARKKVWYEILCTRMHGSCTVGWSNHLYQFNEIGDDDQSYGIRISDTFSGLIHNKQQLKTSILKIPFKDVLLIGVALDLVKGEIQFSINGDWLAERMTDVPLDAELVPGISGRDAIFKVKFGEADFVHGPPDPTFQSFIDAYY